MCSCFLKLLLADSQRDQHVSTSTNSCTPKFELIDKEAFECNCPNEFVTPMSCECTSPKRIYFDCSQIGKKESKERKLCVSDYGKVIVSMLSQPQPSCIGLRPSYQRKEFETIEDLRSLRDKIKSLHMI
jgi:hypothetical protein